ncbi:MAG: hypothetical protein ACRDOP_17975, partial [Gaiellaceae bacterium]
LDELLLAPATPAVPAPRRSGGKKSKKRPPWSASSSSSSPSDGPRLSPNSWLPDWMREND